ncbi:sulfite reductase flavo protein alpha-component [Myriangium duriaei CBS 260.36]|uniref:Sulfite reductase flavo protein alpha-component n=1 Tax=Myriangium duriaei CBS 260.36 TaxID=1168546 RepID=A0A9P4JB43_9PEZI|nr:sulfite reductase flavo protein alpha-component [Myriangium duriaei CBS 260.36]
MRRHSFHSVKPAPRLRTSVSAPSSTTDSTITRNPPAARPAKSNRSLTSSQSPRSSAESMNWSEEASDSETLSTPPSEMQEQMDDPNYTHETPRMLPPPTLDFSIPAIAEGTPKRRRASTNLIATEDIQRLLGDGTTASQFLEKYCCGEGCCMVKKIPMDSNRPGFVAIPVPQNDAFKALKIKLFSLSLDTLLTNVMDLPPTTVALEPLDKKQVSDHKSHVYTHPPEFVQPHPPYEVFSAPLYHARQLTKSGAEKRTYHFDLDITDYPEEGGVDFKVGGAVGVCPPNDPQAVDDVFNLLGVPKFLRDKAVKLKTGGGRWPTIWGEETPRELITTRRELLTWCSDITSTPPTKPLLRLLAEHASVENEKQILLYLSSAQGKAAFCDLRTGPFITLPQLLHAFPSSKPPLESIFSILPQLMPRFYSLSNDPFESSAREGIAGRKLIEMAVTVAETPDWTGSHRTGVGSGFLERMAQNFIAAQSDATDHESCMRKEHLNIRVPMFRGLMANPLSREFASDGPMMLIGAGVGMAPFRGFILNRLRNANCANKIWLVQGVRDSMLDEIYAGELGDHEKDIKKVVQSRAKPPPVAEEDEGVLETEATETGHGAKVVDSKKNQKVAKYVQDEVRLQADIVWFVINALDGRIFVCGSTKGMGEGVMMALIEVAMEKGNLNMEEAKNFWDEKQKGGQYIAETW